MGPLIGLLNFMCPGVIVPLCPPLGGPESEHYEVKFWLLKSLDLLFGGDKHIQKWLSEIEKYVVHSFALFCAITKSFVVYCRDPKQLYVYYHMESPAYITLNEHRKEFLKFDGSFINLTMTYRSDSHVSASYRIVGDLPNIILNGNGKQWVEKQLARKGKLAVRRVYKYFYFRYSKV